MTADTKIVAAFVLFGALVLAAPSHAADERPNVLVILTDDLGYSDLGCFGGELPERPLFFEHQGSRAMRPGAWKIVWSKQAPHEFTWELYDSSRDRCELDDLATKYPARTAAMAEAWLAWAKRVKVNPFFTE